MSAIEQNSIRLQLNWNNVTRLEFFDVVYGKDNEPLVIGDSGCGTRFPYGGTCVQQHSRYSDEWRVHLMSPFPGKGWLPLKHPKHGWLMSKEVAIQFAREMQP